MTKNNKTRNALSLTFDAEQLTQVLMYEFTKDGKPAITTEGPYAGCIQFDLDDEIHVQVTMTDVGADDDAVIIEGFDVVSLDIVSQPNVTQKQSDLSPFIKDKATISLDEGWTTTEMFHDDVTGTTRYLSHWGGDDKLTIVSKDGFWNVSGFLSVSIHGRRGGIPFTRPRVFSFDPELETGGDQ